MTERRHRSFSGPSLWLGSGIPAPLRQAWGSRPLVCPGCLMRFRDENSYVSHWYGENMRENAVERAA